MSVNFSSWPAQQEQTFVVFENYRSQSQSQALVGGLVAGGFLLLVAIVVFFGFEPQSKDMTKDMNMSNISTKKKTAEPAAPAPDSDKK
jgi:hypothetical protein